MVMQISLIRAHALCKSYYESMNMCGYTLHFILFVTEITLDKINHATNIILYSPHTGIISVEYFVVLVM